MALNDLVGKFRRLMRPWETGTEPLEVRRAVLEEIEGRVVAVGGGRRVFPFNRIEVRLLAPDPQERALFEAVVREGWDLEREVRERLRTLDARFPPELAVEVSFTERGGPEFGDRRFRILCHRVEGVAPEAPGRPALDLTVVQGKATRTVYTFLANDRITVGRLEEVLDADGRVKRRNDVAFLEEGEVSPTVSREHARIVWDEGEGEYRLRDDGSASGTRLLRDGRSLEVSGHDRRGVRLRSGDQVYFGRASVKVTLRPVRAGEGPE
jgi:hypothetical protein